MESIREGILLLSARPEAHEALMSALSRTGVNVRVARHPDRALELLRRPPTLVLVDLEYRQAVDHRVVATLNEQHGGTVVLALHEGHLDAETAATADLAVDGYCRADAGRPVIHAHAGMIKSGTSSLP
jgi:DNA-binding response OmpR family regulator